VCAVVRLLSEDLAEFEHMLVLGRALGRTKAIVVDGRGKLLCGGQRAANIFDVLVLGMVISKGNTPKDI